MTKQRYTEANKIFRRIAKSNKKSTECLSLFEAIENRKATEMKAIGDSSKKKEESEVIIENEDTELKKVAKLS
jgi:hypothetical protein